MGVGAQHGGELAVGDQLQRQVPGGNAAQAGGHGEGSLQLGGAGLVGDDEQGRGGLEGADLVERAGQQAQVGGSIAQLMGENEARIGAHAQGGLVVKVAVNGSIQEEVQLVSPICPRGGERFDRDGDRDGARAAPIQEDGGEQLAVEGNIQRPARCNACLLAVHGQGAGEEGVQAELDLGPFQQLPIHRQAEAHAVGIVGAVHQAVGQWLTFGRLQRTEGEGVGASGGGRGPGGRGRSQGGRRLRCLSRRGLRGRVCLGREDAT